MTSSEKKIGSVSVQALFGKAGEAAGYRGIIPFAAAHAAGVKARAEQLGLPDHVEAANLALAPLQEMMSKLPVALYRLANVDASVNGTSTASNAAYASMRNIIGNSREDMVGKPQWQGEPMPGKTLLIYTTDGQGLGDLFQHAGQLGDASARVGKVVLEVPPKMVPVLRGYTPPGTRQSIEVVGLGDPLPPYDAVCPVMNLPMVLGVDLQRYKARTYDVPSAGYLNPPAALAAEHQQWLKETILDPREKGELTVGINWQGDKKGLIAQALEAQSREDVWGRSLPDVSELTPLFNVKGLRFVNLQFGDAAKQLANLPQETRSRIAEMPNGIDNVGSFAGTMHVMKSIATVSTDTGPLHVAAAVGGKAIALLSHVAELRWPSPAVDPRYKTEDGALTMPHSYYPDMTLFAQPHQGGWQPVANAVANHLARVADEHRREVGARKGSSIVKPR